MDESYIKNKLEDYYIDSIKETILPSDLNIILAGDFNNRAIQFMIDNNYKFVITQKIYKDREFNAIIDLEVGQLCNNVIIFVDESSFSGTLINKVLNKNPHVKLYGLGFEFYLQEK